MSFIHLLFPRLLGMSHALPDTGEVIGPTSSGGILRQVINAHPNFQKKANFLKGSAHPTPKNNHSWSSSCQDRFEFPLPRPSGPCVFTSLGSSG